MNTLHLTPEDWNRYFTEANNPAIEFIDNLISAVKKEWLPAGDVELLRQQILNRMRVLRETIEKQDYIDKMRRIDAAQPPKNS